MRLSHSAIQKYLTCAAQYDAHYNLKIRSEKLGSPLLFGTAVDEAQGIMLLSKMDDADLTDEERATMDRDPFDVFDYHLTMKVIKQDIGPEDIRTSPYIEYFGSDFEPGVLLEEDWVKLEQFIKNAGYEADDPEELFTILKGKIKEGDASLTDQCYFNYASWLSLRRKGHLMLELYRDKIMPLIDRVYSIQRKVDLPNENGDEIIGYIDIEASLVGHEGIFTIDNKTSGPKYKQSDINDKGQLVLYDEFTQNGQAAYIVLLKKPKLIKHKTCLSCEGTTTRSVKKCAAEVEGVRCNGEFSNEIEIEPEMQYQILTGDIDEEKKDLLFEQIDDILSKIEAKEFPQNRDACFQFGKPCAYFNYCRNGSMEGLGKVK
jgi:hypothetical protein